MTRVLVMAPPKLGVDALFRASAVVRHELRVNADPAQFDAVIVVNDGSAESVQRLNAGLELKELRPTLVVAVVSFVTCGALGGQVQALMPRNDRSLPFAQVQALLRGVDPQVRTHVDPEAVTFEYRV
jgi:hypothetical protein